MGAGRDGLTSKPGLPGVEQRARPQRNAAHPVPIHFFEIPPALGYPPTMANQTGPKTDAGKAVTRLNAATYGIYSVTPVVPVFERPAKFMLFPYVRRPGRMLR